MIQYTYSELLENANGRPLEYPDLLNTKEWISKRNKIKERDNNKCTKCKNKATNGYTTVNGINKFYWEEELISVSIDKSGKKTEVKRPNIRYSKKPYHLEVHHNYYLKNKLPWEYTNDALVTLCQWCHQKEHNIEVELRDEFNKVIRKLTNCQRCGGLGVIPPFYHIEAGICFRCKGVKFEELINLKFP